VRIQIPFASASIGQVHRAILKPSPSFYPPDISPSIPPEGGAKVCVKVQFPGIKQSIRSDLSTVLGILRLATGFGREGGLLPKGAFLNESIGNLLKELMEETFYVREGGSAEMFRRKEWLGELFFCFTFCMRVV
jgi:aarF domain-containing kinase